MRDRQAKPIDGSAHVTGIIPPISVPFVFVDDVIVEVSATLLFWKRRQKREKEEWREDLVPLSHFLIHSHMEQRELHVQCGRNL